MQLKSKATLNTFNLWGLRMNQEVCTRKNSDGPVCLLQDEASYLDDPSAECE